MAKLFSSTMMSRAAVTKTYRELLNAPAQDLLEVLENFDAEVSKIDMTIDIEDWLEGYDILSNDCETYMYRNYSNELMTFDDWDALMDFERARHPEWVTC